MLAWARGLKKQEGKVGLRVYTAPYGAGKTRLLIEAGETLRQEGWWVGFLRQGRLEDKNAPFLMGDKRPTLLIVDYTANRQTEVEALLTAAAEAVRTKTRTAPLAIVLLERYMPAWLGKLLHNPNDSFCMGWSEFLYLPAVEREPRSLPSLSDPQERLAFFESARDQLMKIAGTPSPVLVIYPAEQLPEAPLHLSLVALHAAVGVSLPDLSSEEGILEYSWKREKEAWERCLGPWMERLGVAWAMDPVIDYLEQLAVLTTLGRPFPDAPSLAGFLREHFRPVRNAVGQTLDMELLAEQMSCVFPQAEGTGTLIPPVEPDPLADYVLWQVLPKNNQLIELALPAPAEAEAAPAEWAARTWHLCSVLARLWGSADDDGRRHVEGWLQRISKALEALSAPREFWEELEGKLPRHTVLFRELAVLVTKRALEGTPAEVEQERARLLNNLANRLSELGRREEALPPAQEAVQTLAPFFAGLPSAFAEWMDGFLANYLRICEEENTEPALDLPPAVQKRLRAVGENPGLPAEVRELARRLVSLCPS